jgi:hypothetical protein
MTIANSIFTNDLASLPATPLQGRPNTDPDVLAEAEFMSQHGGQTRAEWRAMQAARDRSDWEDEVCAAYDAPVPGKTAAKRLANFVALRKKTEAEMAALQDKEAQLATAITAPGRVREKRDALLAAQSKRLMERIGLGEQPQDGFDLQQRQALDNELAAAEHRAELARIAASELDDALEIKGLQLSRLRQREASFVKAAAVEGVNNEYGPTYRKAAAEVRDIAQKISAAYEAAGVGGDFKAVELPRFLAHYACDENVAGHDGILTAAEARIGPADSSAQRPWLARLAQWCGR